MYVRNFIEICGKDRVLVDEELIWIKSDSNKKLQVFSRNILSGEERQLTDTTTSKWDVDKGGDYLV